MRETARSVHAHLRKAGIWIAAASAAASILVLPFLQSREQSTLSILRAFRRNPMQSKEAGFLVRFDPFIRKAAAGRNVFIEFEGYDDYPGALAAGTIYYRSAYVLHPRSVHVSRDDQVVAGGWEFLAEDFDPDLEWLRQKDVSRKLVFTRVRGPQGPTTRMKVEDVPAR